MPQCKAQTVKGDQCSHRAKEDSDYCGVHQGVRENEKGLNDRQERFCQLYVSKEFFANGTQSYIEAYDKEVNSVSDHRSAQAAASRLLSNVMVCDRINELLDEAGLNDNFVDKELLFLINQHSDYKTKLGAIKEYNKLKTRITDKLDITSKGESISKIEVEIVNPEDQS